MGLTGFDSLGRGNELCTARLYAVNKMREDQLNGKTITTAEASAYAKSLAPSTEVLALA